MSGMRKSEKLFGAIVGGVLALVVIFWIGSGVISMFTSRSKQIADLENVIRTKKAKVDSIQNAQKRLFDWQRRSLPADPNLARSLYQNWLLQTVERVGFTKPTITPQVAAGVRNTYDRVSLSVDATATLDQLVKFLFDFYKADYLHQVTRLTVTPKEDGKTLDLFMTVEALALVGADHKDKLNEGASKRLAMADYGKYKSLIVDRNPFVAYTAPPAPVAKKVTPPTPTFDPAKFTYVTAIMEANETLEVWLADRTQGKVLKLREGDSFEIGALKGSVVRIELRKVDLLIGGQPTSVLLGENLFDAMHRAATPPAQTASGA